MYHLNLHGRVETVSYKNSPVLCKLNDKYRRHFLTIELN